eukprot:scaffold254559_cov32-Tisochrysis_lutea.AAC.1
MAAALLLLGAALLLLGTSAVDEGSSGPCDAFCTGACVRTRNAAGLPGEGAVRGSRFGSRGEAEGGGRGRRVKYREARREAAERGGLSNNERVKYGRGPERCGRTKARSSAPGQLDATD